MKMIIKFIKNFSLLDNSKTYRFSVSFLDFPSCTLLLKVAVLRFESFSALVSALFVRFYRCSSAAKFKLNHQFHRHNCSICSIVFQWFGKGGERKCGRRRRGRISRYNSLVLFIKFEFDIITSYLLYYYYHYYCYCYCYTCYFYHTVKSSLPGRLNEDLFFARSFDNSNGVNYFNSI